MANMSTTSPIPFTVFYEGQSYEVLVYTAIKATPSNLNVDPIHDPYDEGCFECRVFTEQGEIEPGEALVDYIKQIYYGDLQ